MSYNLQVSISLNYIILKYIETLSFDKIQCSVSFDGERGPPGIQGSTGATGPEGPRGSPGPVGEQSRCSLRAPKWENLDLLAAENFAYKRITLTSRKKLLLVQSITNIYGATRVCESICGQVFLPKSIDENQQAAEFIATHKGGKVWLRATDRDQEGIWRDIKFWTLVKFKKWRSKEPNNHGSGEHYVVMDQNGNWIDYYHGQKIPDMYYKPKILCELPDAI